MSSKRVAPSANVGERQKQILEQLATLRQQLKARQQDMVGVVVLLLICNILFEQIETCDEI
jgi:type II secretory pathway component PulM